MLDDSAAVTEALAVLLLIVELFPAAQLAPPASDLPGRARLHDALSELALMPDAPHRTA